MLKGKANAIRELQKWVLNPKADTRQKLIEKISTLLGSAVRGDLDSFEISVSTTHDLRLRLKAALRVLPTALFPCLIVMGFAKAGLLKDPALVYAIAAALVWAFLTVVTEADPKYGQKVDAFRTIVGIFPFASKKE